MTAADPNFHIATPRLYLHFFLPTEPSHLAFLIQAFNATNTLAETGAEPAATWTRDTAREEIEGRIELQSKTGFGRYMISLRPSDEHIYSSTESYEHIGIITMKLRKHPKAAKLPDIGYMLLRPYRGKGYATEAGTGLIRYFEEIGVKEMFGFCHVQNEASKKTLKRLGFEQRGMRWLYGLGDRMDDVAEEELVWVRKGMGEDLSVYGI